MDREDELLQLASASSRYYGKYRGTVADNQDPDSRGRLKVQVPSLLGDEATDWALPCVPFGGADQEGSYLVPNVGATVWVEFEQGDLSCPIWVGTYWTGDATAPGDKPEKRVVKTKFGHSFTLDDTDGSETIGIIHGVDGNPSIVLDDKGGIALTDKNGAQVQLDAEGQKLVVKDANGNAITLDQSGAKIEDSNGNSITLDASGVKISGTQIVLDGMVMLGGSGGEPVIKGQSFITAFTTHMHPTAMGPSGPPIPGSEMSSLSTKVMTS
jgi:uncharacterized protein involved in type VI secretion and phage assembly